MMYLKDLTEEDLCRFLEVLSGTDHDATPYFQAIFDKLNERGSASK